MEKRARLFFFLVLVAKHSWITHDVIRVTFAMTLIWLLLFSIAVAHKNPTKTHSFTVQLNLCYRFIAFVALVRPPSR